MPAKKCIKNVTEWESCLAQLLSPWHHGWCWQWQECSYSRSRNRGLTPACPCPSLVCLCLVAVCLLADLLHHIQLHTSSVQPDQLVHHTSPLSHLVHTSVHPAHHAGGLQQGHSLQFKGRPVDSLSSSADASLVQTR